MAKDHDEVRGELPMRVYISMRVYHRALGKAVSCRGMTMRIEGYQPPEVFYRMLLGLGVEPLTAAAKRTEVEALWRKVLDGITITRHSKTLDGVVIQRRTVRKRKRVARGKKAGHRSQ